MMTKPKDDITVSEAIEKLRNEIRRVDDEIQEARQRQRGLDWALELLLGHQG